MKKKIISLITLLACTALVTACNEETSSDSINSDGGNNNYGDVSSLEPASSNDIDSSNNQIDINDGLDKMIAEFVSDVDITVPSTASYNIEDYAVIYYYAYQEYIVMGEVADKNEVIADEYATLFTEDTNLVNLNDEDYPVEDYGYYYCDSEQNVVVNFYSEEGYFVITVIRYDGEAGTLDVSKVDKSWYVDYINFNGYELIETSITSLIPNYLEIDKEVNIPAIGEIYVAGLSDPSVDENGYPVPAYFSIVMEGDKMLDYASKLETAGYHVELKENSDVTIDWDTYELVEYTYYTVNAYDSDKNIYVTIELDEYENTMINFYNFLDVFTTEKASNTDWTEAEKELMNETLHQVLPFMQFGDNYLMYDASDEDWTLFVIADSYYEDLTADYIDLLLKAGFFVDDTTYEDTYYCLDNGIVYIEIYITFDGGNYLEVYYEDSHLEPLTSFTLDQTSLDIVAGASYQLTPIYNPSSATHPTTWSSSNESVATVSDSGLVTINSNATANSSVVITATTISGKSASCTFTVKANEVTGIAFKQDNYTVIPGAEPFAPEFYLLPYGVTGNGDKTYAVNPDNVGITYSNGMLSASDTAVVGSTATITVTYGSLSATATVTVAPATIKHTLTGTFFGIKEGESSYSTYKKSVDGASYEAQASAGNNADKGKGLQLRSKNSNSGVIGNYEGRTCKSISFTFDSNTQAGRKIDIYASNTPFAIVDMYGSSVTKVGTINYDANNLTQTYTFTDDYAYIGFRSADGALYLKSVDIVW